MAADWSRLPLEMKLHVLSFVPGERVSFIEHDYFWRLCCRRNRYADPRPGVSWKTHYFLELTDELSRKRAADDAYDRVWHALSVIVEELNERDGVLPEDVEQVDGCPESTASTSQDDRQADRSAGADQYRLLLNTEYLLLQPGEHVSYVDDESFWRLRCRRSGYEDPRPGGAWKTHYFSELTKQLFREHDPNKDVSNRLCAVWNVRLNELKRD